MIYGTIRCYDAGRFYDVGLPDWHHEAQRLTAREGIDWHRALERVFDCECRQLTEAGLLSPALEIRFWPSETHGILVTIETPLALVEQIIVLNPIDWLPFLTSYLAPLMAASAQVAMVEANGRIANALIARARHGNGDHIDCETGLSKIDIAEEKRRSKAMLREVGPISDPTGGIT